MSALSSRMSDRPVGGSVTQLSVSSTPALLNTSGEFERESLSYVEELYNLYISDPSLVAAEWRDYFAQLSPVGSPAVADPNLFRRPAGVNSSVATPLEIAAAVQQERVDHLIRNYRTLGHYSAALDPLGVPRPPVKELDYQTLGFSPADLDRTFSTVKSSGPDIRKLSEILAWLQNTYCRSIGVQFMHIDDLDVRTWLQNKMEVTENRIQLTPSQQHRILKRLVEAVQFEEYILQRFQGAKSFSLEGAETLIPLLDLAITEAAEQGIGEVILGMAHRGRLNVLTSIMGKAPRAVFREFSDLDPHLHIGRGDVKYHMGYSNDWYSENGKKVHLSLCFNPSHLEFVNGVAMGRARAKQDKHGDADRSKVMCLLIHGDAAFAGEGIIQETLNLSQLEATRIGGTIHVIVNNQVGFTTGPKQARSTEYASDVAKMLQIPIFHVNGEDPEAVAQVIHLAMEFRKEFKRDVVIDMYCFRRRGHNEQDEPRFTQPLMYKFIDSHESVGQRYLNHLIKLGGGVTSETSAKLLADYKDRLDSEYKVGVGPDFTHTWDALSGVWSGYTGGLDAQTPDVETSLPVSKSREYLAAICRTPEGFNANKTLQKFALTNRAQMSQGEKPLDWATAELLAFASLVDAGHDVRLHGQDAERGTFSSRHSVLHDSETGVTYTPLQHIRPGQGKFEVHNSMLSETGVLGFEYGYSLDTPASLVCWEAQFGDFVNVAQVMIDQFIVSAEDKWNRLSGLVMLLPHGFEGQGPEHSSGRLERFLSLAAKDNIQVCNATTPAQHFHMLRRQVMRKIRKPLVVMTPKSLLRNPKAVSPLADFAHGAFQRVLDDTTAQPSEIREILLCSGKVYYDLDEYREKHGRRDVAIIRVEQLYPLPLTQLQQAIQRYPAATSVRWVQEEPENMGAWWFLLANFYQGLAGHRLSCAARPSSASPATGSKKSHELEQKDLLERAFAKS